MVNTFCKDKWVYGTFMEHGVCFCSLKIKRLQIRERLLREGLALIWCVSWTFHTAKYSRKRITSKRCSLINKKFDVFYVNCCGRRGIKHFRTCCYRKVINLRVSFIIWWQQRHVQGFNPDSIRSNGHQNDVRSLSQHLSHSCRSVVTLVKGFLQTSNYVY